MNNLKAYKLSVDLVKQLIKYQSNVQKALRYNEYEKIVSFAFETIDSIVADEKPILLLDKIKVRVQVLTEMEYISTGFATLVINLIEDIRKELQS